VSRIEVFNRLAALALAVVLGGCGKGSNAAAAGAAAGTRDSAGVRIVENGADSGVAVWQVPADPLVEVGGPDAGFFVVAGALRTAEGFVVADGGTGGIDFYDAEGRHVRGTGGKGRGPGEFQHIGWIGTLPGDSLAAWDPLLRRLSVLAPDGRYVRSFAPVELNGFFPSVFGTFADGSLLVSTGMESAGAFPAARAWRDTMVLLRIGRGGKVADTVGRFPGPSRYAAAAADGAPTTHSVPFGPTTSAAVHRDEVYVATGDHYAVAVHGADGRLRRIIRSRVVDLPVTRREREGYADNLLQAGGSPEEQRARRAAIESAPFPRSMAPVEGLRLDDAGNMWVREAQSPDTWDEFSRWSVFGPHGRRIARVQAPGRFAPQQIGADWVLARKLEADGTARVRLYRLNR
jgi:hypothetical protein